MYTRSWLEDGEISNVDNLIDKIKRRLKNTIEKVSDKVITLRHGENESLGLESGNPYLRIISRKMKHCMLWLVSILYTTEFIVMNILVFY